MKKLSLHPDALAVESFPTGADTAQVLEFLATRPQVCDPFTMPPRCS